MRKTLIQCCIALLFAPVLTLMLIGTTALAVQGSTRDATSSSGTDSGSGDQSTTQEPFVKISTTHTGYWEVNQARVRFTAETSPAGRRVIWVSSDEKVATINDSGYVTPLKAGTTKISAYYEDSEGKKIQSSSQEIEVSGIVAIEDPFQVGQNHTRDLNSAVKRYGSAKEYKLKFECDDTDRFFVELDGDAVTGLNVGETKVRVSANNGIYRAQFDVEVTADPNNEIKAGTITTSDTLPFSKLDFSKQQGGKVEYVTGLLVSTDQGTLYYNYKSEAMPGAGVGQSQSYYLNPGPGQRALKDVTFVPKLTYVGGNVTITYTAVVEGGRQYSCKITFTLKGSSGDNSSAGGINLETDYNTAVKFDSIEFGAVCREKLGTQLDYVIFSQPPERQGTLYTNYSSSGSYGSLVDVHKQYTRKQLDDVWFVPAPGYSNGTVTIYYTGFGTNGKSYSGQVIIKINQADQVAIGGLAYSATPGAALRFDDDDFDEYCWNLLNQEQSISGIRFESLPSESEGILYYDYRTSSNPGTRAAAGTVYYPGTRTPRIDRLVFVPADDFNGTIKIPFTGWTTDGTSFSGNVEINVRGSSVTSSGDIYYYCAPGGSVSFVSSDFTSLSRAITGRTLDYIRFRNLPSTSEGSLYYNNSRISTTGTSYSGSNISRISFRASNYFSGLVNISFVGRSASGDTFSGVITIGSGSGGGSTNASTTSTANNTAAPTTPSAPTTSSAPIPTSVVLSPQKLAVNGTVVDCEKYNLDGSNYFKLRDLAYALNGTGSQFGVGFDAATSTVAITTGGAYLPVGGELAAGVDYSNTAQPSSQSILINGMTYSGLTVYNIGGSNFFQLRQLGAILGFGVDYDASTNTAIVRSAQ